MNTFLQQYFSFNLGSQIVTLNGIFFIDSHLFGIPDSQNQLLNRQGHRQEGEGQKNDLTPKIHEK